MSEIETITTNTTAPEAPFPSDERQELGFRHAREFVAERPWAIRPSRLAVIVDFLTYRSHGYRLTREEIEARIGEPMEAREARSGSGSGGRRGAIALIGLMGVIAPRAANFDSVSSPRGTSIEQFRNSLRMALADDSVDSVLVEIDSPGGRVDQVPEMAAELRAARKQKPIVAHANGMAASAAYWLGSQADELVITPSGEVGSIGVYAAHEDLSGALEQEGVKMTLISAGKYKVDGNPFEPLSEDARAAIQADVDSFYEMFTADVARGRGVAVNDVRRDGSAFGEGRMVTANAALKAGMVDRIETIDQTIRRMAHGRINRRAVKADEFDTEFRAEEPEHPLEPQAPAIPDESAAAAVTDYVTF